MKYLVVDDYPQSRQGLLGTLAQLPGPPSLLAAGSPPEALALAEATGPLDAVLVDEHLAGDDGQALLARLRQLRPGLPLLVLSSTEDPATVRRCLAAGARGVCSKATPPALLQAVLQLLQAGGVYLPGFMAQASAAAAPPVPVLTPRQHEVLRQVGTGLSNKQVARALGMEEKTVKGHLSAIFRSLQVTERRQAIATASRLGLIPAAPAVRGHAAPDAASNPASH